MIAKTPNQWALLWSQGDGHSIILEGRGKVIENEILEISSSPYDLGINTDDVDDKKGFWIFEGEHHAIESDGDYDSKYTGSWRRPTIEELTAYL